MINGISKKVDGSENLWDRHKDWTDGENNPRTGRRQSGRSSQSELRQRIEKFCEELVQSADAAKACEFKEALKILEKHKVWT